MHHNIETINKYRYNSPYVLKIIGQDAYVFNRLYTFIGDRNDHRKNDAHNLPQEDLVIWMYDEGNQPWDRKSFGIDYDEKIARYKQMYNFIYKW